MSLNIDLTMKEHLKNFGKGFLIGSVLSLILDLSLWMILGLNPFTNDNFFGKLSLNPFSPDFSVSGSFVNVFLIFSIGSLLFGLMYVIYKKFEGKKPVLVFSIAASMIFIMFWSFDIVWDLLFSFMVPKGPNLFGPYFIILLVLAAILFLGLIAYLIKIVKAKKLLVAITGIWFLIVLSFYSFFPFIFTLLLHLS